MNEISIIDLDLAKHVFQIHGAGPDGQEDRLGKPSKTGQRDLRRLLVLGATAVVRGVKLCGATAGSWLARMLSRKPPKLIAGLWQINWRASLEP